MKLKIDQTILGVLLAGALIFFVAGKQKKTKRRVSQAKPRPHPSEHCESWDIVDEASWESFPASDPPGHY